MLDSIAHLPLTLGMGDEETLAIIGMGVGVIVIHVVFKNVRRMFEVRQRETTRREIAAYVAEGSIAPEDAALMMASEQDDFEAKIAEGVTWGTISAEKAEQLIQSRRQSKRSDA